MLSDKRRWQRVVDSAASEKWHPEEDDVVVISTDKTRLLSSDLSKPGFDQILSDTCPNVHTDKALENEWPSQIAWEPDTSGIGPRFPSVDPSDFHCLKHAQIAQSVCPSFPLRKPSSHHTSWQGFKQLVKKQFIPPFPFRKDMPLENMPAAHLQSRGIKGAMNSTTASRVLGASTNLLESRRLDVKSNNGMNKSAFAASSKGDTWPNSPRNLGISNATIKMKPRRNGVMKSRPMKERGILKRLKGQEKKDERLLLVEGLEDRQAC